MIIPEDVIMWNSMAKGSHSKLWGTRFTYTGKPFDNESGIGLHYYGARYYDAELGRFMAVDPKAAKYPSLSPYAYCANNPLKFVDSDGRAQQWKPRFMCRSFQNAMVSEGMHNMATTMAEGAPYVRKYWTDPHQNNAFIYGGIATAGYWAGSPQTTLIGSVGCTASTLLALTGFLMEFLLDPSTATAGELGWRTLETVVVSGVEIAKKVNPMGQVAWWIVDASGRVIRMLTPDEVTELGLDDGAGVSEDDQQQPGDDEEEENSEVEGQSKIDTFVGWGPENPRPPH